MQTKLLRRNTGGNKEYGICDLLLVFFVVARQAFRFTPGYAELWPVIRYAFYLVIITKVLKTRKIRKNYFIAWELLFLAMAFLCSFVSRYQDNAIERCVEVFFVLIDVSCVFLYCLPDRKIDLIFRALLISGVVITIIQLSDFSVSAITTDVNRIMNRVSLSENENPNLTAIKQLAAVLSGCYLIYFSRGYFKITVSFTAFSTIGMILTGSRKTFVIAVVVVAFLFISGRRKYLKMAALVFGAVVSYDLIMNNTVLYNIIGWRLVSLGGGSDASALERNQLMLDAIETGMNHLLLGVGLHNSMYYTPIGMYAHNNYAEIFADLGIFGLVIYYSLYVVMLYRILRFTKGKERNFWLLFTLSFLLIDYGQVSYNLFVCVLAMAILTMVFSRNKSCGNVPDSTTSEGVTK